MGIWRKLLVSVVSIVMISGSVFISTSDHNNVEAASSYSGLINSINTIMADSRMKSASTSVTVRKASTGEIVYEHYADKAVTPASTMKLLTGAAALETLGENYRFSTTVLSEGKVEKGILKGNLYLKGQGRSNITKNTFG